MESGPGEVEDALCRTMVSSLRVNRALYHCVESWLNEKGFASSCNLACWKIWSPQLPLLENSWARALATSPGEDTVQFPCCSTMQGEGGDPRSWRIFFHTSDDLVLHVMVEANFVQLSLRAARIVYSNSALARLYSIQWDMEPTCLL